VGVAAAVGPLWLAGFGVVCAVVILFVFVAIERWLEPPKPGP
jgi:uncharacterized membrane protein YhiD involved in acid resistance